MFNSPVSAANVFPKRNSQLKLILANLRFLTWKDIFHMAQYANLLKEVKVTDVTFDVQGMINKALSGILISKGIVTEEEIVIILGNINRQQEIYSKQQNRTK
jgi:predicted transcriptional regulator